MSKELPISVQMLTFNSGTTLRRALRSVAECKELLLIDGGSTDETLSIAKECGAKVIPQHADGKSGPVHDFSEVRNIGFHAGTEPWIMALDSDETVSQTLMEEAAEASKGTVPAAYYVPRKYICEDGTIIQYASTYPNERIYFFHRDAVTQWIKPVHERVDVKPDIPKYHFRGATLAPLPTIEEYKRKNMQYILLEAERVRGKGWMFWVWHIALRSLRSRVIAMVRLMLIWLIPRPGARLPLRHEMLRFWYAWQLTRHTCPLKNRAK